MDRAPKVLRWKPTRVLVLSALLVFLAVFLGARSPSLVYAQRPLSYWLQHLNDEDSGAEAALMLSELGPEALPELIAALRSGRSPWQDSLHDYAARARLAEPRRYDAPNVRATAAYLLGQLGEEAAPATEYLVAALGDEDPAVRLKAGRALSRIGMVAAPAVAAALNDPEPIVRHGAARSLGEMGPQARYAVPALLRKMDDSKGNVRVASFQALAQIGERAQREFTPAHVPQLLEALTNSPWATSRRFAVETLRRLGPTAREAGPVLSAQRAVWPELIAEIDAAREAIGE